MPLARAQTASCGDDREVVEFSGVGSQTEIARQRACFVNTVRRSNVIVRLGPQVDFNFSDGLDGQQVAFPVVLGSCVAITGVDASQGTVPCPKTLNWRSVRAGPGRSGAGTLTIDPWRGGHFYNPATALVNRPARWDSDAAEFKY